MYLANPVKVGKIIIIILWKERMLYFWQQFANSWQTVPNNFRIFEYDEIRAHGRVINRNTRVILHMHIYICSCIGRVLAPTESAHFHYLPRIIMH